MAGAVSPPLAGLAMSESRRSNRVLLHDGHSAFSPERTNVWNSLPQSSQLNP